MTAHRMALVNPKLMSLSIECREFPQMAADYDVYSVPRMVINEDGGFVGGLPERDFITAVIEAAGATSA